MGSRTQSLAKIYFWTVTVLGLGLMFTHLPSVLSSKGIFEAVFLGILVAAGESASVPFPKGQGTISVSTPIIFTLTTLYGPSIGMWIAALFTLRKRDLEGKVPLSTVLFNRAVLALSCYSFSLVYQATNGKVGMLEFPQGLISFFLAATAHTFVNAGLIGEALALQLGVSFWSVCKNNVIWVLPNLFALFPLGALMVLVSQQMGPFVLVLFYIPLMVAKGSLQKYLELKAVYEEMAATLSNTIDARDSYTRGHSERVAEYAGLVAKELHWGDEQVELIKYVGLLHDVGKVGIRDSILKKPGPFTAEEYEEMKKHAEIGADIIQGMKFLGKGQEWVRHHHERWDGTGFPSRLKGEEIPMGARIIACTDAFDAMTTDRPYKQKMSFEEAKQELLRCANTQFDPEVVKAMIKVIDTKLLRK